jgi:ParB/RepB/Spo0J family partition protein
MSLSSFTVESVDDDCEVGSRLRLELDQRVDVPQISSLFELENNCIDGKKDYEFWRCIAIAASEDICLAFDSDSEIWPIDRALFALKARRSEWPLMSFEEKEAAISGEINLFIQRFFQNEEGMLAKTGKLKAKTNKAKPETKPEVLETDDELLKISLSYGEIVGPHSDEELLAKIIKRWNQAKGFTKRPYSVRTNDHRYGVAIWFSESTNGIPAWFYDVEESGCDDLDIKGDLLDQVRRVLSIDLPTVENTTETVDRAFAAVKAKGKSRAKQAEPATSAADLLQGVIVVEERDVDYDEIVRSKQNPRHDFDADLIAQMRPNIVTICQVNPLTIREGSNELIDGETRHRAGDGVAKALRCKIIRCTDAQAALMRLQTSMQRRDLNPIEKAQALADMLDKHGMTQRQLTDIVKLEQSTIDNFTRLLKLPDNWKQQLISGEITASSARELVPWIEEKKVLDEVLKVIKKIPVSNRSAKISDTLNEVASNLSRPLMEYVSSGHPNYRQAKAEIKLTPELRKTLRVKTVTRWGKGTDRAFNIDAWHQLMQSAKTKALDSLAKKDHKSSAKDGKVDPKRAAENAKKQKEIFQKKLYRYKISWLQDQLLTTIAGSSSETLMKYLISFCLMSGQGARVGDVKFVFGLKETSYDVPPLIGKIFGLKQNELEASTRTLLNEWLSESFDGNYDALSPATIEEFARFAGIDLRGDWPASCKSTHRDADPLDAYLQLLSKDLLIELAEEWRLSIPSANSSTRAILIAEIADAARGKPAPKALLEVQPIRLK